jgi:hypothetical protein
MSDSNTKQLQITGGAAEDYSNQTYKRRRGGGGKRGLTAKARQEGGTSPGTITQLQSSSVPSTANAPVVKPSTANILASPAAAAASTPAPANAPGTIPTGGGVNKKVRVLLAPPRKKAGNVVLAPPKQKLVAAITKIGNKTRKVSKKIRMSLGGLKKRLTRQHHIKQESKKISIETVKKTLTQAGLIKADSKAPESVLRQMYADFQMLKNRAL